MQVLKRRNDFIIGYKGFSLMFSARIDKSLMEIVQDSSNPAFSDIFEDKGMVELAELLLPAPSVMRGPFTSGFLANSVFQVVSD